MKKYKTVMDSYINREVLITFMSEEIGELYKIMEYMGENENYFFDSAAPMKIAPESDVILTTTSICMLHRYNILSDIKDFVNPFVLRGVITKIKNEINLLNNNIKKEELKQRFSLSEDNQLERLEYLNDKVNILEEIKSILEGFNIIDIYNPMKENILSSVVPSCDVESAQYAKSHDMYLFIDDIGSIGLFETFLENEKIINTSGMLTYMISSYGKLQKYKTSLLRMIKDKYLFSIDFRSLCMIIGICIEENKRDDLREIIRTLIEYDYEKQYYRLLKTYMEISPNCRQVECELIDEIIRDYE